MWAALSAVFVVLLIGIIGSVIWLGGKLIAFLQPILIPIAIAAILAYLLDPLVTQMSERAAYPGKSDRAPFRDRLSRRRGLIRLARAR